MYQYKKMISTCDVLSFKMSTELDDDDFDDEEDEDDYYGSGENSDGETTESEDSSGEYSVEVIISNQESDCDVVEL